MLTIQIIQRFDWNDPSSNRKLTFKVTEMLDDISANKLKYELITSPLDREFAETWVSQRDIHQHYVNTMPRQLMNTPLLGVWMEDETVLLIDGSHRYMARYKANLDTVDCMLIEYNDWQSYAKETLL